MTHNEKAAVAHFVSRDDADCLAMIRELMSFLSFEQCRRCAAPRKPGTRGCRDESLNTLVPSDAQKPYDMKDAVHAIVDDGYFFEVHEHYAKTSLWVLPVLERPPCRHRRNQPAFLAGGSRYQCFREGARASCRFCDAFNIPLITFETFRFPPATQQEFGGIISTVQSCFLPSQKPPSRKSRHHPQSVRRSLLRYGSKHIRTDANFAWPTAEIAVMAPSVNIVYKRELDKAPESQRRNPTPGKNR